MNKRVSYTSLIASLIVLASPFLALAQASPVSQDINSSAFINPSFQVGNIQVNQATLSSGTITGTVDVLNDNPASFGNIRLQLLLLEPAPVVTEVNTLVADNARTIDRIILPETYSFSPNETKTIPFTYNAPKLPAGQYRIRLQVVTTQGYEYGWDDYALQMGVQDASFLLLSPQPVIVKGEEHYPNEGVNVEPGTDITLPILGTLSGSSPLTATPVLTIYAFDLTGEVVSTQKGSVATITPGKDFLGEFKVVDTQKPGAYHTTLAFVDGAGNRVSSLEQYHYVVTGITGRIISAEFTSLTDKQAVANFKVVGPADGISSVRANAVVSLLDGTAVIAEETAQYPNLGPEGASSATATFDLSASLKDPGLRIVLTDATTGLELDRYEMHVAPVAFPADTKTPAQPEPAKKQSPYGKVAIILVLVLLCIAAAAVLYIEGRNAKRKNMTLPLILLTSALSLSLVAVHLPTARSANGILIGASSGLAVDALSFTINKPIHNNTTPYSPSSIPISFAASYQRCDNAVTYGSVGIYNLSAGGKVPLTGYGSIGGGVGKLYITGPAGIVWDANKGLSGTSNGSFTKLAQKDFTDNTNCSGGDHCLAVHNYTGTLSVPSSSNSTTLLWVISKYFTWTPRRSILGMYTWLNFAAPATPFPTITPNPTATPIVTPTPFPTITPIPTRAPSPTPTITPAPSPTPNSAVTANLTINGSDTPAPSVVNQPIALSWTSTNANTCSASSDWSGVKAINGSENTTPTQVRTYTYTITCRNTATGRTATDATSIVVGTTGQFNPGNFEETR